MSNDNPSDTPAVLFLCMHNVGRSQMAAVLSPLSSMLR